MNYKNITTSKEMNLVAKDMLRLSDDNYSLYALKYIEELEDKIKQAGL